MSLPLIVYLVVFIVGCIPLACCYLTQAIAEYNVQKNRNKGRKERMKKLKERMKGKGDVKE